MPARRAWHWFLAAILVESIWLVLLAWLAFRHAS